MGRRATEKERAGPGGSLHPALEPDRREDDAEAWARHEAEDATLGLGLVTGDVVRGRCLIDDVVVVRRSVSATADGPVELVSKNPAQPNISGQDRSGTGGGSPT